MLGVRGGTAAEPRVRYLDELVPVTAKLLELANPVQPMEVFRFGAPCAESACAHFANSKCGLVTSIVENVPAVVEEVPACRLRSKCRWWHQEGLAACLRCPVVITQQSLRRQDLESAAFPKAAAGQEHRQPSDS